MWVLAGFVSRPNLLAIVAIFSPFSCRNRLYARLASAREYLLLRSLSFVDVTIMTATGNDRSSTSSFVSWLCPAALVVGSLTRACSMASLILCSALAIISVYSGLSSSVVFRSSCSTCFAASGVKGYFAQSVGVRIRFVPSAVRMEPLFCYRCGCYSTSMRGAR